jgi:hypothetical protein
MNNKLEHIIIKYLNKMYGDLEEYKTDKYPNSIYFVKGKKVYMEQDLKNRRLYVDYGIIWSDLGDTFSLKYNEIQSIITKWVEETYNLRGFTPYRLKLHVQL